MIIKAHYNGNVTITSFKGNHNRHKIELSDKIKKRVYKLKYSKYRQLAGNSAKMFETKINKILFLTFTIKDNIKDTSLTNNAWSYFLNLMKKRHGLNNYLWVAERQKRGAIHYHTLMDMPFIQFKKIKEIFSNSFAKFGIAVSTQNSVSASKKHGSIVKNVEMALRYITKYISKSINKEVEVLFSSRMYAITNEINVKPLTITYDEYLSIINTCSKEYNFKFSATYICDLKTIISLFNTIKQQNTALKVHKSWFITDKSKEIPTFELYENINIPIKYI